MDSDGIGESSLMIRPPSFFERTAPRRRGEHSDTAPRPTAPPGRTPPAALCLVCFLTACSTPGFDLDRSQVRQLQERGETSLSAATSTAALRTDPYRVQAGDRLALRFFFNPEFDQEIRVQPDGAVSVPLLGTRVVRDMSIPEITEMVRVAYAEELQQPQVVVQLLEASERMVYVGGAVNDPREILYRQGLTPLEVVLAAGGFASTAEANQVILIRKDHDGRPVPAVIDLEDMVMQADATAALQPWDIVFVPKDGVSKANEWVDKYLRKLLLINGISFGYVLNPDRVD